MSERVSLRTSKEQPDLQALKNGKLQAEAGIFKEWFAQDSERFSPSLQNGKTIELNGYYDNIPASQVPNDSIYMMRFNFELEQNREVRIMFNSASNNRVWLNGEYIFGRESGRMAPSFHRAPVNQFSDVKLEAGKHELLVGVAPANDEKEIKWVIGIGDTKNKQWLPGIFK